MELLFFYLFAGLLLFSAIMVIRVENPVHAVLYLVLVFCLNSFILLLIGAEFLSLLLLIVYVGAIAILFLFVVMMLPIKNTKASTTFLQDIPIGVFIGFILAAELILIVNAELPTISLGELYRVGKFNFSKVFFEENYAILAYYFKDFPTTSGQNVYGLAQGFENAKAFGIFLFTNNYYYVLIAGFILLLGIVGAVMLARHDVKTVHKQEIYQQLSRRSENSVLKARFE
jgi:NADH-quinone oxidoreductase subunit J